MPATYTQHTAAHQSFSTRPSVETSSYGSLSADHSTSSTPHLSTATLNNPNVDDNFNILRTAHSPFTSHATPSGTLTAPYEEDVDMNMTINNAHTPSSDQYLGQPEETPFQYGNFGRTNSDFLFGRDLQEPGSLEDFINEDFTAPTDPASASQSQRPTNEEPQSATSVPSSQHFSNASRKSTGLAAHTSSLMSPVPTEGNSPGSMGGMTPPARHRLLGGAPMSRISSRGSVPDTHPNQYINPADITPTLSGRSANVTPEPATRRPMPQAFQSPEIRIGSYTRGDSPARAQQPLSSKKRARSSSLAVPEQEDAGSGSDSDNNVDPLDETHPLRHGRGPGDRPDQDVLNFQDRDDENEKHAKRNHVTGWLVNSEAGFDALNARSTRQRPKSFSHQGTDAVNALGISGLGQPVSGNPMMVDPKIIDEPEPEEPDFLIDDEDETGSYAESEPMPPDDIGKPRGAIEYGWRPYQEVEREEKLNAFPWIDPVKLPSKQGVRTQPETANAALYMFTLKNRDLETASRAATWGTTRRRSEGDLESVFGPEGWLARLSIGKESSEARNNFIQKVRKTAAEMLPKRSPSTSRRKQSEPVKPFSTTVPSSPETGRKQSESSRMPQTWQTRQHTFTD